MAQVWTIEIHVSELGHSTSELLRQGSKFTPCKFARCVWKALSPLEHSTVEALRLAGNFPLYSFVHSTIEPLQTVLP